MGKRYKLAPLNGHRASFRYAPRACDTWSKTHGRSGWRRSLRKATGLLETLFEGAAQVPVFTEHHTPTGMQPPPPQRSCCHCTHPCQSPCSTSLTCHLSCETASCTVQLKDPGVLSPEVNVVMHAEQPPDKLRASSSSRRRLRVAVGGARALRASSADMITSRCQRTI